jgi:hypothetical protein
VLPSHPDADHHAVVHGPNRVRWFRTFAMNVSQIYDGVGEPVEMKIKLEGPAS